MQSPQTFSAESGAQQKSAIGMQGNLAAALGYPIGILGLVSAIIEKDNKFVKFHGFQSVFWSLLMTAVCIVVFILAFILNLVLGRIIGGMGALTIMGLLMTLLIVVVSLVMIAGMLFAAFKAYGGQMFKLPIVGNMAEKFALK